MHESLFIANVRIHRGNHGRPPAEISEECGLGRTIRVGTARVGSSCLPLPYRSQLTEKPRSMGQYRNVAMFYSGCPGVRPRSRRRRHHQLLFFSFAAEKSILWPGPRCGRCYQPIRWFDNIPLSVIVLLRGRCRTCGGRFPPAIPSSSCSPALMFAGLFYVEIDRNILELPYSRSAARPSRRAMCRRWPGGV